MPVWTQGLVGAVVAAAVLVGGLLVGLNARAGGLKEDGPANSGEIVRLGHLLRSKRPVHIIWVHGIGAVGAGDSAPFRDEICKRIPALCVSGTPPARSARIPLDIGPRPSVEEIGASIWNDDLSWRRSRPFLDRYTFTQSGAAKLIVDEINWWPLVFPLKCTFLVAPDAEHLAGIDSYHLSLCALDKDETFPNGYYYPWIRPERLSELLKGPTHSGGGALINRDLKLNLLNWGLSDAVAALGAMRVYFRRAIDRAFEEVSSTIADGADPHIVVISESLGSFIVMDAFDAAPSGPTARVLSQTSDLYFFANQFALLELARINGAPPSPGFVRDWAEQRSAPPLSLLQRWAAATTEGAGLAARLPQRRQIVSFSDPSDVLTYYVPAVDPAVKVLNLYDRNAFNWFGLLEDPAKAHTGHAQNPAVLQWMLEDKAPPLS